MPGKKTISPGIIQKPSVSIEEAPDNTLGFFSQLKIPADQPQIKGGNCRRIGFFQPVGRFGLYKPGFSTPVILNSILPEQLSRKQLFAFPFCYPAFHIVLSLTNIILTVKTAIIL
ncbi:hypothetical protein [Chitinophaga japonensis]|uniref:hypothetical protein n=1 Tax=Chitinophaga japonensis TaxID=104662 RepID=UPI001FCE628A|nr:hypothetical protein [Chitinophaga japonensis]